MSKEVSFKNRQVLSISLDTFYTNKNYVASEFIEKAILFYIAVELGKLTHLLAVAKDVDDETLRQLIVMCINEVRKINGAIDCEDAVRYQKE